jgi:hypothetical protein
VPVLDAGQCAQFPVRLRAHREAISSAAFRVLSSQTRRFVGWNGVVLFSSSAVDLLVSRRPGPELVGPAGET